MKKSPIVLGPTGLAVMRNVAQFRRARNLTYAALSERLAELGRPIPALGLSRIERGERRVDADDLVMLSRALETEVPAILGLEQPGAILDCQEFLIRVQVTPGAITAASST